MATKAKDPDKGKYAKEELRTRAGRETTISSALNSKKWKTTYTEEESNKFTPKKCQILDHCHLFRKCRIE